jgi:tetratricopeptide (TPR) repeat protein
LAREPASTKSHVVNRKSKIDPDLDWIVLKCLEKDRARRYETANGLAADIQRHLNNEPVAARPPSAMYRLQKFVRRNRTASLAAALVALAVLSGVIVSTSALLRERAARKQADNLLSSSLRFVEMFNGVAPEIRRVPGAVKARESLGETSLAILRDLRAVAPDNAEVRDALVKALIYLGETQGNIGEANVVGDYESGLQRGWEAVELLSTVPVAELPTPQLKALVIARGLVAASLMGLGRYDEAISTHEGSDPLLARLERSSEDVVRWARTMRPVIRANAGFYHTLAGRPREGLENYLLPVLKSDWAQSVTTNSGERDLERLANLHGQLTQTYLLLQQYGAMTDTVQRGLALQEALVQRFPDNVRHLGCLSGARGTYGHALMYQGRSAEALKFLKQSRDVIDDLVSKDADNEFPRVFRVSIVRSQARAFAVWSEDESASLPERQQRLAQAESYLLEAETFELALKGNSPVRLFLEAARAEVAAARAKLESVPKQP